MFEWAVVVSSSSISETVLVDVDVLLVILVVLVEDNKEEEPAADVMLMSGLPRKRRAQSADALESFMVVFGYQIFRWCNSCKYSTVTVISDFNETSDTVDIIQLDTYVECIFGKYN